MITSGGLPTSQKHHNHLELLMSGLEVKKRNPKEAVPLISEKGEPICNFSLHCMVSLLTELIQDLCG